MSPESGRLVPPELRGRWRRLTGTTFDVLASELKGREVGMLLQDTPHPEENQSFEYGLALDHAAEELLLVDGCGGWAPTLEALCAANGTAYRFFRFEPHHHWFRGGIGFGLFRRSAVTQTRNASKAGWFGWRSRPRVRAHARPCK